LASAALGVAATLGGCQTDGGDYSMRALQPLSQAMLAELERRHMRKESPILVRLFKEEAELEVWKEDETGRFECVTGARPWEGHRRELLISGRVGGDLSGRAVARGSLAMAAATIRRGPIGRPSSTAALVPEQRPRFSRLPGAPPVSSSMGSQRETS